MINAYDVRCPACNAYVDRRCYGTEVIHGADMSAPRAHPERTKRAHDVRRIHVLVRQLEFEEFPRRGEVAMIARLGEDMEKDVAQELLELLDDTAYEGELFDREDEEEAAP